VPRLLSRLTQLGCVHLLFYQYRWAHFRWGPSGVASVRASNGGSHH